jgi:hypothetical protein
MILWGSRKQEFVDYLKKKPLLVKNVCCMELVIEYNV